MKSLYLTFLFVIFFACVIASQFYYDRSKARAKYIEPHIFKPEVIKAADLGLHNAAGDLFWLASIQYFGGGESKTYEKMSSYLNLATDLNPKFPYPYAFGALVLPSVGQTDQAIELAKKGIYRSSPDWRIAYYLATTYFLNKDDYANALKYFDIAANTQGAPEGIKKIAANFGTRGDKRTKTKQIWTGIYATTKDEVVKERAKTYLVHYEIMDFLEEAAKQYYKMNGKYPEALDDLVTGRILKAIPEDPFGFTFEINADGLVTAK